MSVCVCAAAYLPVLQERVGFLWSHSSLRVVLVDGLHKASLVVRALLRAQHTDSFHIQYIATMCLTLVFQAVWGVEFLITSPALFLFSLFFKCNTHLGKESAGNKVLVLQERDALTAVQLFGEVCHVSLQLCKTYSPVRNNILHFTLKWITYLQYTQTILMC